MIKWIIDNLITNYLLLILVFGLFLSGILLDNWYLLILALLIFIFLIIILIIMMISLTIALIKKFRKETSSTGSGQK